MIHRAKFLDSGNFSAVFFAARSEIKPTFERNVYDSQQTLLYQCDHRRHHLCICSFCFFSFAPTSRRKEKLEEKKMGKDFWDLILILSSLFAYYFPLLFDAETDATKQLLLKRRRKEAKIMRIGKKSIAINRETDKKITITYSRKLVAAKFMWRVEAVQLEVKVHMCRGRWAEK